MAPEKWTPERRRQLTRDALVASARQVFARRGFHAASLDDIAEAAGFTRGAVYSNFENKEDLFFAVLDHHVELQLAAFQDFFEQTGGPSAAIDNDVASVWRRLTGGDDSDWIALSLEFRLYALRNPDVRQRFVVRSQQYRDTIVAYLTEVVGQLDRVPLISLSDLAAIADWGAAGIIELSHIDPSQSHVLASFLDVLNHGAFGMAPGDAPPEP